MNDAGFLPYAAVTRYTAIVVITTWLSYRRIMKKQPSAELGGDARLSKAEPKRP